MAKYSHIKILYVFILLTLSCEKIPQVEASDLSWGELQSKLEEDGLRSEQRFRHPSMSEETYQGAINAVKKAYQLTDITFSPLLPIAYNQGTYKPNSTYKGMIYSSVKEIGTYVGSNVSFHTFMTAIHNPRSRIYTDRIDEPPYNGTNCRAYYGTVCSGLVSYALGLIPVYASFDFVDSSEMEELDYSDFDGFHIADVLWRSGHVAMISNVVRDADGKTVSIEISEAVRSGCRRYSVSRSSFLSTFSRDFKKVFRYKFLDSNTTYISVPEFVPVLDEQRVPFVYNDDICVDKGDQSCYFVGEEVKLIIFSPGDVVEVYKDSMLYSAINVETDEILLSDLDYGRYQARVKDGDKYSAFTSWIIVDRTVVPSVDEMRLYFNSKNASPVSVFLCGDTGGRNSSIDNIICRRFTGEEISNGYIEITADRLRRKQPFFVVSFSTEFGIISTPPIEWK